MDYRAALIVGAGSGLSASIARRFSREGMSVALAARGAEKLENLCRETGAKAFTCDASDTKSVNALFEEVHAKVGSPDVVVFNASRRVRGSFAELSPSAVESSLSTTAFGGFLVAHRAVQTMIPAKHGAILFTGASASVKGYANSAPFAMGKFALRGLAQSMARELAPQGIHIAHFIIDGSIRHPDRMPAHENLDSHIDPDAIAETYLHILHQPRSAWTYEVEIRPWTEQF